MGMARVLTASPRGALAQLQRMWELPAVSHFIWLFQDCLCVRGSLFTPAALEAALLEPRGNPLALELLSKLVIPDIATRRRVRPGAAFAYESAVRLAQLQLELWLSDRDAGARRARDRARVKRRGGGRAAAEDSDSESHQNDDKDDAEPGKGRAVANEAVWRVLEGSGLNENPLAKRQWHELSAADRLRVIKAFCDVRFALSPEFVQHVRGLSAEDARVESLGPDSVGRQYFYFGFNDCRVYRLTPAGADLDKVALYDAGKLPKPEPRKRKQPTGESADGGGKARKTANTATAAASTAKRGSTGKAGAAPMRAGSEKTTELGNSYGASEKSDAGADSTKGSANSTHAPTAVSGDDPKRPRGPRSLEMRFELACDGLESCRSLRRLLESVGRPRETRLVLELQTIEQQFIEHEEEERVQRDRELAKMERMQVLLALPRKRSARISELETERQLVAQALANDKHAQVREPRDNDMHAIGQALLIALEAQRAKR